MVTSAGILPYRASPEPEVYLIHMGGPYWRNRERAWSIVKGIVEEGEDTLAAARREFAEETGQRIEGELLPLGEGKSGSKRLVIYAVEAPGLSTEIRSNTFRIEWPPHSGEEREFPEADLAAWMPIKRAERLLVKSQLPFLDRLKRLLAEA